MARRRDSRLPKDYKPSPSTIARFSDNPFRPKDLSPEENAWRDKRNEALRIFRQTGDKTMAQEIGLFPKPKDDEGEAEYEG